MTIQLFFDLELTLLFADCVLSARLERASHTRLDNFQTGKLSTTTSHEHLKQMLVLTDARILSGSS
ncbi:MAG: hypothetical protein AAF267_24750 [Deinococcota bacterium]